MAIGNNYGTQVGQGAAQVVRNDIPDTYGQLLRTEKLAHDKRIAKMADDLSKMDTKGIRQKEIPVVNEKMKEIQEFYIKNEKAISDPARNPEAYLKYKALQNDLQGTILQSKAKQDKFIQLSNAYVTSKGIGFKKDANDLIKGIATEDLSKPMFEDTDLLFEEKKYDIAKKAKEIFDSSISEQVIDPNAKNQYGVQGVIRGKVLDESYNDRIQQSINDDPEFQSYLSVLSSKEGPYKGMELEKIALDVINSRIPTLDAPKFIADTRPLAQPKVSLAEKTLEFETLYGYPEKKSGELSQVAEKIARFRTGDSSANQDIAFGWYESVKGVSTKNKKIKIIESPDGEEYWLVNESADKEKEEKSGMFSTKMVENPAYKIATVSKYGDAALSTIVSALNKRSQGGSTETSNLIGYMQHKKKSYYDDFFNPKKGAKKTPNYLEEL